MDQPEPLNQEWIDWGEDDESREGPVGRFIGAHTNWFCLIVCVAIAAVFVGVVALGSNSGPGLVYDPQVVHRVIETGDGHHVDCVFTSAGTSCDWEHSTR
jgi:hypothetical protein